MEGSFIVPGKGNNDRSGKSWLFSHIMFWFVCLEVFQEVAGATQNSVSVHSR